MDALYLVGFIQALFFIGLILTKKKPEKSDFMLSLFLLIMGLRLFFNYTSESGFYQQHPKIILIEVFYWTLLGPSLYLYIDLVTSDFQKFKLIYLIHLIPSVIVFAGISEYLFSDRYTYLNELKSDHLITKISNYVWLLNTHVYYIFCLIKLTRHKKKIKKIFSYTKRVDLKWLNFITYGFALFLFYFLIYLVLRRFFELEIPFISASVSWVIMVSYIFGVGFYGFKQQGVFNIVYDVSDNRFKQNKKPLYEKSGLNKEEKTQIIQQLEKYMKEKKPYLDPELNIRQLAGFLNIPVHKLSQTLNQSLQKTFFEYINEYRVKEALEQLAHKDSLKYSIMSIAYDCGFNSKTTFYNIFKKFTSKTPTEYRESFLNVN